MNKKNLNINHLLDFMQSLIISTYLGSKLFSGTVVLGKTMKLLKGKTAIFFGKSSFFINLFITYLILLE